MKLGEYNLNCPIILHNEKVHLKKKRKEEGKENRDNTETNEMMEPEVAHVSKYPF
jgi:hypothetical protein